MKVFLWSSVQWVFSEWIMDPWASSHCTMFGLHYPYNSIMNEYRSIQCTCLFTSHPLYIYCSEICSVTFKAQCNPSMNYFLLMLTYKTKSGMKVTVICKLKCWIKTCTQQKVKFQLKKNILHCYMACSLQNKNNVHFENVLVRHTGVKCCCRDD